MRTMSLSHAGLTLTIHCAVVVVDGVVVVAALSLF